MNEFFFRGRRFGCELFIDDAEFPCYVFAILHDAELIGEFGKDITLKTDLQRLLPRRDDMPDVLALRKALFQALQKTAVFLQKNEKWQAYHL